MPRKRVRGSRRAGAPFHRTLLRTPWAKPKAYGCDVQAWMAAVCCARNARKHALRQAAEALHDHAIMIPADNESSFCSMRTSS